MTKSVLIRSILSRSKSISTKVTLSDVVVAINKNTTVLSNRIDNVSDRITVLSNRIDNVSDCIDHQSQQFGGYQKKESLALEEEIGKAIVQYYDDACKSTEAIVGYKLLYGSVEGELDVVVNLKDGKSAVAEVKKSVGMSAINQLLKNAKIFESMTLRRTILLLGGIHYERGVEEEAMRRGISLVETSGGRFRVRPADKPNINLKKLEQ